VGDPGLNRASLALILATLVGVIVSAALLVADARDAEVSTPLPTSTARPFVSVPLPSPGSVVRHSTEYVAKLLSPLQVEADLDDSRVLLVHVYDEYRVHQPECSTFDTSARVVGETGEEIVIATFGYQLPVVPEGTLCASMHAVGEEDADRVLRLRLRAPLGFRRVIDARTGEAFGPS